MGKNFSCNNLGQRKKSDLYETPYSLSRMLLHAERFKGSILEPACGNGAITKILSEKGLGPMTSYDLSLGKDFLDEDRTFDNVITNPPYSLAKEFILKAKQVATSKIAFLLPLSYLHGKERYEKIWTDKEFPLARIHVFTRYPLLGDPLREDGKTRTGMMVYCWAVWFRGYECAAEVHWLDNDKYILSKADKDEL